MYVPADMYLPTALHIGHFEPFGPIHHAGVSFLLSPVRAMFVGENSTGNNYII